MKIISSSTTLYLAMFVAIGCFVMLGLPGIAHADDIRNMVFPVIGTTRFSDDFGAARTGHTHQGIDVFGTKMQQLVAVTSGYLSHVAFPEPYYGYGIFLRGDDGYEYWYLHVNNDTPGTDDGQGGGINAYAIDIMTGYPVTKGQLVGYMGDSGNAETTSPHLHFEIHRPDDNVINPYLSLTYAPHIAGPIYPPPLPGEILPYQRFQGGASISRGDVDPGSDGQEIITAAGPGGGPDVRVYSSQGWLLRGFFPYPKTFRGGIDVSTADIIGDGIEKIITGAGPGGGPQVVVSDSDGHRINQFMAYPASFRGGIRVASADLTGDGVAEIVTVPASQGRQPLRVFNRWGDLLNEFYPFGESFTRDLDVAASADDEFHAASIIVAAGEGAGPQIKVFTADGELNAQFFAYDTSFRGGVHVDVGDVNEDYGGQEIITVPASRGGPQIRVFDLSGHPVKNYSAFEPWWRGGYDIGAGDGVLSVSTQSGARRTSVRKIEL